MTVPAAPVESLKVCTRILATMAERNGRIVENRNWQKATEGIVGLRRDVESLMGFAEEVIAMDFSSFASFQRFLCEAAQPFQDERQLEFRMQR